MRIHCAGPQQHNPTTLRYVGFECRGSFKKIYRRHNSNYAHISSSSTFLSFGGLSSVIEIFPALPAGQGYGTRRPRLLNFRTTRSSSPRVVHGLGWIGLDWVGLGRDFFQFLVGWFGSTPAKVLKF